MELMAASRSSVPSIEVRASGPIWKPAQVTEPAGEIF